jgi:hypothetical protein
MGVSRNRILRIHKIDPKQYSDILICSISPIYLEDNNFRGIKRKSVSFVEIIIVGTKTTTGEDFPYGNYTTTKAFWVGRN